jgi:S1-C subfamily serine protease
LEHAAQQALVFALGAILASSARAADEVNPLVLKAEAERIAVVERASSTAVAVMAPGGQGGGSAVVISPDGYALSNYHVTREAGEAMKCGMADGRLYDAVIVGIDPTGDVALIKLLGREDFPHAEMADSDRVAVGDWCFAIGNPFLLATDFKPTVSYGVISGVHRYQFPAGTLLEYADCLQADAAINPGNSGGPLFDADGRLIGINGRGSFEKRGRVNVGVGYAISINQIKHFLAHLKSGRIVDHATLGASVATNADGRVLVDDILDDSDAARRGLRFGDEVVAFGGRPIASANAFKNVLGIFPKGWRVPLTYRRGTEKNPERAAATNEILVRLAGVHRETELQSLLESSPSAEPKQNRKPGGQRGRKPAKPAPDKPEQPTPDPEKQAAGPHPPKPPMPEIVKQHFTARVGYVNYYFNQLNQDRVWKAAMARGDFATANGKWTLAGELAEGGDWQITLDDQSAEIRLPGGEMKIDVSEGSLAHSLGPPESGGLLVAMSLWRRMLILGPQHFGQVHYLGAEPLAWTAVDSGPVNGAPVNGGPLGRSKGDLLGQMQSPSVRKHGWDPGDLYDVLVGAYQDVETRLIFHPGDGQLAVFEMSPDEHADPCEIYFSDYHEQQGRWLPGRFEVRYSDRTYHSFEVRSSQLDSKQLEIKK